MRNLRLDICYDGTKYKGWQRLPGGAVTIQGKLEQTLSRILGEEIEIAMHCTRWQISIVKVPCPAMRSY